MSSFSGEKLGGPDLSAAVTTIEPDYPPASSVAFGVTYNFGASVGTLESPDETDVRDGVAYGVVMTGNLVLPPVEDVQTSVQYGANGTEFTGTFAVPAVGDVQSGVQYGAGGTEFTGDFVVPLEAHVQNGVGYGSAGTEFTGTLVGGGGPAAFDIEGYTINAATKSLAAEDGTPLGVSFKPDGLKMYYLGSSNDRVYQYTLTTAYDLSTASYDSVSLSISAQTTLPGAFTFKPDGTKLFIAEVNLIYPYTLSTPWDLSTATYDGAPSASVAVGTKLGLAFKPDGSEFSFLIGGILRTYSMSTAWDVTTASLIRTNSSDFVVNSPRGIFFKSDGTKLFIVESIGYITQYGLSVAWDINSTVTIYTAAMATIGTVGNLTRLFMTDDGSYGFFTASSAVLYRIDSP